MRPPRLFPATLILLIGSLQALLAQEITETSTPEPTLLVPESSAGLLGMAFFLMVLLRRGRKG